MRLLRSLAILAVLGFVATPAAAQQFQFTSPNPYGSTFGWGAYVGPYQGYITPGGPVIDVICVDYLHGVTSDASDWDLTVTSLSGDLSNTYQMQNFSLTQAAAKARYQKAAWLYTQMTLDNRTTEWEEIHGTIWSLMSGGTARYGGNPIPEDSYWIGLMNEVDGNTGLAAWQTINLDNWQILTDTGGDYQEYMTAVPEPGTLLLLGSGLLGLGLVFYRRLA